MGAYYWYKSVYLGLSRGRLGEGTMVNPKSVTKQLRQIGCDYGAWGRTEIKELSNVLMDNEQIMQAVNGYYDGGFALLCTTNYRVLIIDKKPFLLTVDDLRYDMIAEVHYSSRIITAVLHIITPVHSLEFVSWSRAKLRNSMNYIQQRVMELRNNDYLSSQFATTSASVQKTHEDSQRGGKSRKRFSILQGRKQAGSPAPDGQPGVATNIPIAPPQLAPAVPTPMMPHRPRTLINPYTKVPLLARRRKYPSFY